MRPNNKKSIFIYRFLDGFSDLETRIWCLFAPQGENLHFPGINMMFCIHLRRFGRRFGKIDFFSAKCFFLLIKIDFFNKKSIFHFSKKSIFLIDFFQIKNYARRISERFLDSSGDSEVIFGIFGIRRCCQIPKSPLNSFWSLTSRTKRVNEISGYERNNP